MNLRSRRVATEKIGWVYPREGGGTNHLRDARPTGKVAHIDCLTAEQFTLFKG